MERRTFLTSLFFAPAAYLIGSQYRTGFSGNKLLPAPKLNPIPSGFHSLDRITNGFFQGEVTVIAGRPSMGKTAFAMNIVCNVAIEQGRRVAYVSLELARERAMARLLAQDSGIGLEKLARGPISNKDWDRLFTSSMRISDAPIHIGGETGMTPKNIRAITTKMAAQTGIDMLIIDYYQLLGETAKVIARRLVAPHYSEEIRRIAKDLNIPVLVLSQLNRSPEEASQAPRPVLADLEAYNSFEKVADQIIFLYRKGHYDRTTLNRSAELIVAKNRRGRVGTAMVRWGERFSGFENV